MFERMEQFLTDSPVMYQNENEDFFKSLPFELHELIRKFGGKCFFNGGYRVHTFQTSVKWNFIISEYFKNYSQKIYPFSFDWMGRQFCLSILNDSNIYMFDPSTGEDFILNQSIAQFHNSELIENTEDYLNISMLKKIEISSNISTPSFNECFGLKIPFFLGGVDTLENYEKIDSEVYWHITSQLYKKSLEFPDGTSIGNISIG